MAHITFVSVYDRNANGLRLMSANLKAHGHRCSIIFLKHYELRPSTRLSVEVGEFPWEGINKNGRSFKYAALSPITTEEFGLLRQLLEELRPDLVGLTVNTPLRLQAAKVTSFIKEHFTVPIIWGGVDATTNPADCLRYVDCVCIGEGDQTILDVAERIDQGRGFEDIRNLAAVVDGTLRKNPPRELQQNLDLYPCRDNAPDDKYSIFNNKLVRNYPELNDRGTGVYQAMSSRGCPNQCSYCCESIFKRLYAPQRFLRRRSPQNMLQELIEARKRLEIREIHFLDEVFSINPSWLGEFLPLYKKEIALPFEAYLYPTHGISKNLKTLRDAGLKSCCVALQSGSERINRDVFERPFSREAFLETTRACKELGIWFYTDVITFNPYEEEEDLQQTLDVLMDVGGGFFLNVNKLFVLPGTRLAAKFERDGMTTDHGPKEALFNYYSRLFWITSFMKNSRPFIELLQKVSLLRRHPALINPALIEFFINPLSYARSTMRDWLPPALVHALHKWKLTKHAAPSG